MVKKRVRSLLKIYFSIAVIITVAFCFNAVADEYDILVTSKKVIKVGDILKAGDYISRKGNDSSYNDEFSVYYYDNNNNQLHIENVNNSNTGDKYEVKKIDKYSLWQIESVDYYLGGLSYVSLVPAKLDGPNDQKVTKDMSAKFTVEPSDELGDNLTYSWYQFVRSNTTIDESSISDYYNDFQVSYENNLPVYTTSGGGTLYITIPSTAKSFSFDYESTGGIKVYINSNSINYNIDIEETSGTKTIYFNSPTDSDYNIQISNYSAMTIKNLSFGYEYQIPLTSTTKDLIVSSKENSHAFKDNNEFIAIVSDGNKNYKSKVAKLNIVEGKKEFPTPEDDKLITEIEMPDEYKLKIFNITDKVENTVVDKINGKLEKDYKSIEVFNVGMYLNDELIDIGEGNYLLKINKPKSLKNYTNIKVSELDENYNIIKTEEPTDDNKTLTFTVNKLNNFVFSGKEVSNPVTLASKSPIIMITILVLFLVGLTGGIIFKQKINKHE